MATEHPIILHHFPESPFSEKIRLIFGIKKIAWTSVEITRIMPRPDLMPLTGGYRKTPVMQIGADIYCDTQLIMLELDKRLPAPGLLPKGREGEARAITMWADRTIFGPAVGVRPTAHPVAEAHRFQRRPRPPPAVRPARRRTRSRSRSRRRCR